MSLIASTRRRVASCLAAVGLALALAASASGCGNSDSTSTSPAPAPAPAAGAAKPAAASSTAPAAAPAPAPAAGDAAEQNKDTILIGHYGSLTGSEATFGKSTSQGIRLAMKEFNAAGGLSGKKIELKEYDTRGEPGDAKLAVERLVKSDKVVAVLGEVASKLSLAGGPVCQEAGVPMITPSSTNERVTQVGDYIFRVCFTDGFQGLAGAKFARDTLKVKTAALLVDQSSPYAVGLADGFEKGFVKMGGTIATRQNYTAGANDYTAQLTNIRSSKPDLIYIPGYYTDIGNITVQVRKIGITAKLLGGDGWDSEQLARIAKDAIEGCYYTNHYAPDQPENSDRVKKFIADYGKEFGGETPDGLAALGYDAARVLFEAMKRAGGTEPKKLRDAIAATKDFPGVTGNITINEKRDATKSAVVVEMSGDPPAPHFVSSISPN